MSLKRRFWVLAPFLIIAGCGGGSSGSGSTGSGAITNRAPVFSGGDQTATVPENSSGTIFTVSASDPDGDNIQYSVSSPDGAFFTVDSQGAVSFISPPNFDLPRDGNHDNRYVFMVEAGDGRASSSIQATVDVTNLKEGVSLKQVASFNDPGLVLSSIQGSDDLVLVNQDGETSDYSPTTGVITKTGTVFLPGENGTVLGVGEDRGFNATLLALNGKGTVLRIRGTFGGYPSYKTEVLDEAVNPSARGFVRFDRGHPIFVGLGDPDGSLAQDETRGFGKIFSYFIDPYCGASLDSWCVDGGPIAIGVHEPVGIYIDGESLGIFDRGTSMEDEVSSYYSGAPTANFGWPFFEGYVERGGETEKHLTTPTLIMSRGSAFGQSNGIVGGDVYGGAIQSLQNKLVFGDISGRIFTVPATLASENVVFAGTDIEERTADFALSQGSLDNIKYIVVNGSGNLFILDNAGNLFTIE